MIDNSTFRTKNFNTFVHCPYLADSVMSFISLCFFCNKSIDRVHRPIKIISNITLTRNEYSNVEPALACLRLLLDLSVSEPADKILLL